MNNNATKRNDERIRIFENIFLEIISSIFVGLIVILVLRILFRS